MSDSITTLVLATGGAFLGKFVGPAAESLGKVAWERAQQLGTRATALLATSGREPQSVEPKTLFPLVQAASLETDPSLAEKWVALLANAADPTQQAPVQPSFVEVLRQLTPIDARVVAAIYKAAENATKREGQHMVMTEGLMSMASIDEQDMRLSLDNLLRLQLCKPMLTYGGYSAESFEMPSAVLMTTFGLRFVQAVTPPGSSVSWPFTP